MQRIIEKYQSKIEKLTIFEKQTLKRLVDYSSAGNMSRFYLVFDQRQIQSIKSSGEQFFNSTTP